MSTIYTRLSLDSSDMEKGLTRAQKRAQHFKKQMVGALQAIGATAAVSGLIGYLKRTTDQIAEMNKQARALGVSLQEMEQFAYVARLAGTEVEQLSDVLLDLNERAADFDNTGIQEAFQRLGINTREFIQLRPQDQLALVSAGLQNLETDAEKLFTGIEVMGDGFKQVRGLIEDWGTTYEKKMGDAATTSEELAKELAEQRKLIVELQNTTDSWGRSTLVWLAKMLKGWQVAGRAMKEFIDWAANNLVALGDLITGAMSFDAQKMGKSIQRWKKHREEQAPGVIRRIVGAQLSPEAPEQPAPVPVDYNYSRPTSEAYAKNQRDLALLNSPGATYPLPMGPSAKPFFERQAPGMIPGAAGSQEVVSLLRDHLSVAKDSSDSLKDIKTSDSELRMR